MIEVLREKANNLPLKPGVYIMKNQKGEVIYVGKAVKLKNRVSSYFHGAHNAKTELMISKIHDFDVIIANSEFEALVLENSLIKHHMPQYNILLKDDKGYPFVRLDAGEEYPRFSISAQKKNDGAMYFGPFGGRTTTFSAIDAVLKALKLPTCSRKFPRDIGKERPCLNHHLGTCKAYCLKDVPHSEYKSAIDEAIMIFEGKTESLLKKLKSEMLQAAENLRFELAAELRDRIRAIEALKTKQRVLSQRIADTDIVGFYRGEVRSCFVVLHYIDGSLLHKEFEIIDDPIENDCEIVEELVRQFYLRNDAQIPKLICLPFEIEGREALEKMFAECAEKHIELFVPQRGDKYKLVQTATLNAKEEIERITTAEERNSKTAEWLKNALGLANIPNRIEAFDISNTAASDIVAGMTVFVNGKPLKRDYRKFKMKSISGPDDYASMAEAVTRRFTRLKEGDEKFSVLPDILLIDGGVNHAKIALDAINSIGVNVPVFGMVKDDRHRTRALVSTNGEEIGIEAFPPVFSFIGRIQEETHRYAVEYHHVSHKKSTYASALDGIKGLGDKRKAALIKAFGTVKAIKNAEPTELEAVLPKNTAFEVWKHFHIKDGKEED